MDYSIKRKRINYSVKTKMQLRMFMKVYVISLTGAGLMAGIFYFYSNRAINASYRQFHQHADNFLDFLLPAIILSMLVTILLSAAITLFLPIKYAGPLFRIERDFREKVGEGDLTIRFILRPGDEVFDLADSVNTGLDNLGQKISSLKESVNNLESVIEGDKGKETQEVTVLVRKIKEDLNHFKV